MKHSEAVTAIARSANAHGYHFGAIIFQKKTIISAGWCQAKSHPAQARAMHSAYDHTCYKRKNSFLHAEIHAIVSAKCELDGSDIIIARWAEGQLKNSYPCKACQIAIEISGIRNVWYTDNGKWIKEKFS